MEKIKEGELNSGYHRIRLAKPIGQIDFSLGVEVGYPVFVYVICKTPPSRG
jgi:hypothetical protein